jgi:hypothetical protein
MSISLLYSVLFSSPSDSGHMAVVVILKDFYGGGQLKVAGSALQPHLPNAGHRNGEFGASKVPGQDLRAHLPSQNQWAHVPGQDWAHVPGQDLRAHLPNNLLVFAPLGRACQVLHGPSKTSSVDEESESMGGASTSPSRLLVQVSICYTFGSANLDHGHHAV